MTEKKKNKLHALLMTILVILAVFIAGAVVLLTHTQIMVGAIKNLSQGTVNTKNLFEPLHEPLMAKKNNGQYIRKIPFCLSDIHPLHPAPRYPIPSLNP